MTPIWYSPIYTDGIDQRARFPRQRYRLVWEGLDAAQRSGEIGFHEPEPLPVDDLLLAHHPTYVKSFLSRTLDEAATRRIGLLRWRNVGWGYLIICKTNSANQ